MKKANRIISLFAALMITAGIASAASFPASADEGFTVVEPSKDISVRNDDGNGSVFGELPANYVRLGKLDLTKAEILLGSDSYRVIEGLSTGDPDEVKTPHLVYTGKVNFGGSMRTRTADASTRSNLLPAVSLRFPGAALLSDGNTADVVMTIDHLYINITRSYNSSITSNSTVMVPVLRNNKYKVLWFCATSPKTGMNDYSHNAMAGNGQRMRVSMKITDPETGEPVDAEKYPSMLVLFNDLDVPDEMVKTTGDPDLPAYWPAMYKGKFTEGIELVSGWGDPVALAPVGSNIYNRPLVLSRITGDNLQIRGDGEKYKALGSRNDTASFYSGFAAPVRPQGFSFYWTGSVPGNKTELMGTIIGSQPTVAVWAKRTEGGSLRNSAVGDWQKNTHLMNSSASYDFRPDSGYRVRSVTVDGVELELTDEQKKNGGEYVFARLNKNPVSERIYSNGQILDAAASSHYEIEAVFEKAPMSDLSITKNVTGNLGDKTKEFSFRVELEGLEKNGTYELESDGAVIAGLTDQAASVRADSDGKAELEFKLKDDAGFTIKNMPQGASFVITESASDHVPSFTITSPGGTETTGTGIAGSALSTQKTVFGMDGCYTAEFVNDRKLAVITGVPGTGFPRRLFIIPTVMALLTAVYAVRGCRTGKE